MHKQTKGKPPHTKTEGETTYKQTKGNPPHKHTKMTKRHLGKPNENHMSRLKQKLQISKSIQNHYINRFKEKPNMSNQRKTTT